MPLVENYLLFTLIVSAGIFVQSAAGFAAGLIIISLMGYAGYGIPEAQAVMLVATIPQNVLGLYRFRKTISKREIVVPAAIRILALPAGLFCLWKIDGLPVTTIRQILGFVVLMGAGLLATLRPVRSEDSAADVPENSGGQHLSPMWTFLAFTASGFFGGLTGTGGPPMVVWVHAHRWSTERTRAFLFAMYLTYTLPGFSLLWWTFGNRVPTAAWSVILLTPVLILVSWCGLRFGSWLGRKRLRHVTIGLLCVIAAVGVLTPILSGPEIAP